MQSKKWSPLKRVTDRRRHFKLAPQCYAVKDSKKPGYPMCPGWGRKPTCQGRQAAFRRAILQGKRALAAKIKRAMVRAGCAQKG